ncbi:MAG TPA: hypothetical protein VFF75_01815 [Methylophilaceae bacterium]|nr:hypothetical protein [Methylophilaceae bacterium]
MDILNSAWFLGMLKKSGRTPQQRLLAMFDILDDWLHAPVVRNALESDHLYPRAADALEDFLTQEAKSLDAAMPELLAQQLYFIALTALKEEIARPDCGSIKHARVAANALLQAQKQRDPSVSKPVAYGLAASLFASLAIGNLMFSTHAFGTRTPSEVVAVKPQPVPTSAALIASPSQTAELFASLEQMRKGTCHFPEALQLPDSEKAVYLENVVGGQITVNVQEQALVRKLMGKVRCNYTPMLMANSIS